MSAYTVNEDNLFFEEKMIVCSQKLDRIYQLRLMTLYHAWWCDGEEYVYEAPDGAVPKTRT